VLLLLLPLLVAFGLLDGLRISKGKAYSRLVQYAFDGIDKEMTHCNADNMFPTRSIVRGWMGGRKNEDI